MKRLALILAVFCAFSALATEQYLYWMVGGTGDYSGTWDSVRMKESGEDSYLTLYSGGAGTSLGTEAQAAYATSVSGLYAALGASIGSEYLVDLMWGDTAVATTTIGGSGLDSYLTASLLSPASSPLKVSGFAATGAVPEPTSGLLLLLGVAALAIRRKGRAAIKAALPLVAAFSLSISAEADNTFISYSNNFDNEPGGCLSVDTEGEEPQYLNFSGDETVRYCDMSTFSVLGTMRAMLKDGDFICAPPGPHTPNSPSSPPPPPHPPFSHGCDVNSPNRNMSIHRTETCQFTECH